MGKVAGGSVLSGGNACEGEEARENKSAGGENAFSEGASIGTGEPAVFEPELLV